MTWNEAGSGSSSLFADGFGWGGVLLVVAMVVALAVVSGLGILARMRDRATERKAVVNPSATRDDDRSGTPAAG
jgi:cytochrome b